MGKTIKSIKIISFILIIIQLVMIGTFCVFYFNNFFSIQNYVTPSVIVLCAAILVFIDSLFVWLFALRFSSLRQKTDLHAAEVIGSDVQEAYNFAMIGLAVTNDKDIVIWTNDLFKDRHIDIIDVNIFAWHNDLLPLKENDNPDATVKIVINSRNYEAKYLPEAGLWIFKDVTDFESVFAYSKEQAPVVGILAIDNYDDVVRGEDDFNDIVTKVKNVIFNYAKEYGILLRRVKDDNYSMLCNFDSFSKMKDDHFSVIDKVRQVSSKEDIPLTLSIGMARDFPDVIKLNELATAALDIAMSRGGDQAVVSVFGSEMEFYGGKTEAQEKRNRVKVRVLADSLISLIKNASNILIMGHTEMDMDSFGACLGIKSICNRLEKPSLIVADLKNTETKARSTITTSFGKDELDDLIINSSEAIYKVVADTLLIVVDVHIPSMVMAPKLLDKCSKVVVIDHHRRAEDYIENPVFNHIDAAASSTCELVAEFIRFSSINPRIEIPPIYATIMLSGIFLDSSFFKSKSTGMRTFEAATILKEYGADNSLAYDFLKDDYEEHKAVTDIIDNLEHPFYGVVVAAGEEDHVYDQATLAKAANECLTFKGIHAAFIIGKTGNRDIRLSTRSDGTINVQLIAEKLGGGGHFSSAAVAFDSSSISDVKTALLGVLETNLTEATNDAKKSITNKED
ncbi:MAG TPA: DHH family phosphoesterase [Bacilli bacterium]|nr:DHH family phosphoesterase [Bacilli bacterium]HPS18832.1 DHH family phosphoesterase [Bacilli bacterium]